MIFWCFLRQQTIQAINDNPVRHKNFANWVGKMLAKDTHDNHYMSVGIISTEIAEKITTLSKSKHLEQVLVMRERDFTHSNSPKHRQKGVALTEQEFVTLPKIISNPLIVVWDKRDFNYVVPTFTKSC